MNVQVHRESPKKFNGKTEETQMEEMEREWLDAQPNATFVK